MPLNRVQCIEPKEIRRIHYSQFTDQFAGCLEELKAGVVFLVHGNEKLTQFYKRFLEAHRAANNFGYFRENPVDLQDTQDLQKALFEDLKKSKLPIWCDSFIRLRRTVGPGAFNGPHIDKHVGLSENCINFWISFSDLQKEEALTLLSSKWIPSHYDAGNFRQGTFIDRTGKLFPQMTLIEDIRNSPISKCEYIVFMSGRTAHCSPFGVIGERITADQRIFIDNKIEDSNFHDIFWYYKLNDQGNFDGAENLKAVLDKLQLQYQGDTHFYYYEYLKIKSSQEKIDYLRSNLDLIDPSLMMFLVKKDELNIDDDMAKNIIQKYGKSTTVLESLLDAKISVNVQKSILPLNVGDSPRKSESLWRYFRKAKFWKDFVCIRDVTFCIR